MGSPFATIASCNFDHDPGHTCTLSYDVNSLQYGRVTHMISVGESDELLPNFLTCSGDIVDYTCFESIVNKVCEYVAYIGAFLGYGVIVHIEVVEPAEDSILEDVRRKLTFWCSQSVLDRRVELIGHKDGYQEIIHSILCQPIR